MSLTRCYKMFDIAGAEAKAEFDAHEKYHSQRFTGNQKVQMVINGILEKHDELIEGNMIEPRSLGFHYNVDSEEQEQVLKMLQDEHVCRPCPTIATKKE